VNRAVMAIVLPGPMQIVQRFPAAKPFRALVVLQAMVRELGLQERVEFRSYVPYAELPDLYRGALAFVYPSLWEGFGLPVLEAFACGTPVITSIGSATEDLSREAAILLDPTQDRQIAEAIEAIILEPCLRYRLVKLGLLRAQNFGWSHTRHALLRLIRDFMNPI